MALERTYIIPLRRGWLKAARYKRAKKAVNTLKEFLARHMKSETVLLMPELNVEIWKHGMKNPPSRVKVNVVKDDKGVVRAQLFGKQMVEEKKEEKKGIVKKIAEKVTGAPKAEAPKVEAPKSEAKPEPKTAPKAEVKQPAKPARAQASADQPTKSALPVAEKKPEAKLAPKKPAAKKTDVKTQ